MRRRFRKQTDDERNERPSMLDKIPLWAVWLLLAILVLGLVFNYDRTRQHEGRNHMETGRKFEREGNFESAAKEYKAALHNKRLAADQRAEAAALLGDLYLLKFDDPVSARDYYTQAKIADARVLATNGRKALVDQATRRGSGSGTVRVGSSKTEIRRVELVASPAEDSAGEVVAKFTGGELRHGAVARALRERGHSDVTTNSADYRLVVAELADRALLYQAAIDAGLHADPDISRRLYEFQRSLLEDRYVASQRTAARIVTSETLAAEVAKEAQRLTLPARLGLAMIKSNTADDADKVMAKLRAGNEFGSVAANDSTDTATKAARGVVGMVAADSDFIPGLGRQPELIRELATLEKDDITSPIAVNNAHYIFKLMQKTPEQKPSEETLNARVESALRAKQIKATENSLRGGLRSKLNLSILVPETTSTPVAVRTREVVQ